MRVTQSNLVYHTKYLYDQVDVWVGMMNFLLDLVVPSFQVVGGVGSLGLVVVP
jgi:hypothetical protein